MADKNEVTRQFEIGEKPPESRMDSYFSVLENEDHMEDLLRGYMRVVRDEKIDPTKTHVDMAPRSNLIAPPGMSQDRLDAMALKSRDPSAPAPGPVAKNGRKTFSYDI